MQDALGKKELTIYRMLVFTQRNPFGTRRVFRCDWAPARMFGWPLLRWRFATFILSWMSWGAFAVGGAELRTVDTASLRRTVRVMEGDEIDLGTIWKDKPWIDVTFRWHNTTDRHVEIESIVAGCYCSSVSSSTPTVPPGGWVDFTATVDTLGIYGAVEAKFLVAFKDRIVEPKLFTVRFRQEMPPRALPGEIDFGEMTMARGSSVRFSILAITTAEEGDVRILNDCRATDARVSCRLINQESTEFRRANTTNSSVRFVATLEATAARTNRAGPLQGEIQIPLLYGGRRVTVTVPFDGRYAAPVVARPARLVVFLPSNGGVKETKVGIYTAQDQTISEEIRSSCDHARIRTRFVPRSTDGGDGSAGDVLVWIDATDSESFDTEIRLAGHVGGSPFGISIPVTVRINP